MVMKPETVDRRIRTLSQETRELREWITRLEQLIRMNHPEMVRFNR